MYVFCLLFNCFVLWTVSESQDRVYDVCELPNGEEGLCLRFEHCPSAINLIRHRRGTPIRCGFEGKHPIVCCERERKAEFRQRQVGEMSKQKCAEMYHNLQVTTTTTTESSTTTESTDHLSLDELIELAIKEEEEAKLAGKATIQYGIAVVGGVDAKEKEFLHMAALGYGYKNDIKWLCGGSLISERHVLTAAHCISTQFGPIKIIRVGDLNLKLTTDIARPQDLTVARTIIHPDYKAPSVYHDIAILELSQNVRIDDYVRPGCLNTEFNIPEAEEALSATGWGSTSFQGQQSDHLQEVTLKMFTWESCQEAYSSTLKRRLSIGIDNKTQLCAGEEYRDTCQGDSGGPLQVKNQEYQRGYKIIGVTSFGKACGIGNGPSVYVRVSSYIQWIESVVWP